MKFIITALMLLNTISSFAQSTKIIVTAQNKSITVSGEDDNNDKLLVLKPVIANATTDYLTVKIINNNVRKTWKRAFYIYDENKQTAGELKFMSADEYCIKMKDVLLNLHKEKEYSLYAVTIPQDQTKAFMVKIPPVLLCKIKLED